MIDDTLEKVEEKEIVLAFFDILGSSQKLNNNQYRQVYDFYSYMIQLCSEEEIALSIPGTLPWERGKEMVLTFPMKHAFFSDTFILWVEYDSFLKMRLGGFYEKCISIFIKALKKHIPLRGAISRGTAIMDEYNKIYLGKPIVEAAKAEVSQEWLGISLTLSCEEFYPTEARYLLPYTKHIKPQKEDKVSNLVLDWPRYWREKEKESSTQLVQELNSHQQFSLYYEKTIDFIEYSKENCNFMCPIEKKAPPLCPWIVLDV